MSWDPQTAAIVGGILGAVIVGLSFVARLDMPRFMAHLETREKNKRDAAAQQQAWAEVARALMKEAEGIRREKELATQHLAEFQRRLSETVVDCNKAKEDLKTKTIALAKAEKEMLELRRSIHAGGGSERKKTIHSHSEADLPYGREETGSFRTKKGDDE